MEEFGLLKKTRANVPALLSLIISILSLVCCCVWHLALLSSVTSIVLGIFGINNRLPNGRDMAIAGIVIGVVALALSLISAGMAIYITR